MKFSNENDIKTQDIIKVNHDKRNTFSQVQSSRYSFFGSSFMSFSKSESSQKYSNSNLNKRITQSAESKNKSLSYFRECNCEKTKNVI